MIKIQYQKKYIVIKIKYNNNNNNNKIMIKYYNK